MSIEHEISFKIVNSKLTDNDIAEHLAMSLILRELQVSNITICGTHYNLQKTRDRDRRPR